MEYLSKTPDLAIINLIDSLRLIKDAASFPLFYKTDHHWNPYGAFQASQCILKRLKVDFPNLDSLETSAYNFELQSQPGRVTARMLKLENHLKDDNPVLHYHGAVTLDTIPNFYPVPETFPYKDEYVIILQSSKTEAPSMMMVRESFGVQIIPVLSHYFSKSTYVFDTWNHKLNPDIVENEKPDIYLQMIYERLLDKLLND